MFAELLQQGGLSFDRLQSFCLVAQAGGVTKAAQGDPTKQSLFSRQIKELEEFFGTELIRRKGRGVVLTDFGIRLNIIARECFTSFLDFKQQCKNQPVEIVIGTGESLVQWVLMPKLDFIRTKIPQARLKLLNLPSEECVRRLSDGMIDFALVRSDAVKRPLHAKALGTMGYSLFLPSSLNGRVKGRNVKELLDGLPLATLEGQGHFRSAMDAVAKQHKINLNIQVECSSFTLAARALAGGKVAAILPSIASEELKNGDLNEIPLPILKALDRDMCLATSPRLLRIRPLLEKVGKVLEEICRF